MTFMSHTGPEMIQGRLDNWTVTILGSNGIRLSSGTHFHLDEGPDFAYLSIYRAAAGGRQIDIVRNREATMTVDGDEAIVTWEPCEENNARLAVRYHMIPDERAIEMKIRAETLQAYQAYELFISSYFTPYHIPRFALKNSSVDPSNLVRWYQTKWCGEHNDEAWPRDEAARQIFLDGRWMTKPVQNWTMGGNYAMPLMTQRHRFASSIISMASPEDCIGLSGYNGYHNSQYFHLFGCDTQAGDLLETSVRMEIVEDKLEDLDGLALQRYQSWETGVDR